MTDATRMTPARKRALEAVERGEVVRVYDARGNRFVALKGVSGNMLWNLMHMGWIRDEPGHSPGVYAIRIKMMLAPLGREILESSS